MMRSRSDPLLLHRTATSVLLCLLLLAVNSVDGGVTLNCTEGWTKTADGDRYFKYAEDQVTFLEAIDACKQCQGGHLAELSQGSDDVDLMLEMLYNQGNMIEPEGWIGYMTEDDAWKPVATGMALTDAELLGVFKFHCVTPDTMLDENQGDEATRQENRVHNSRMCLHDFNKRYVYAKRATSFKSYFKLYGMDAPTQERKRFFCERPEAPPTTPFYDGTAEPFQFDFDPFLYLKEGIRGVAGFVMPNVSTTPAAITVHRDWDRFLHITIPVAVGFLLAFAIFFLLCKIRNEEKDSN